MLNIMGNRSIGMKQNQVPTEMKEFLFQVVAITYVLQKFQIFT